MSRDVQLLFSLGVETMKQSLRNDIKLSRNSFVYRGNKATIHNPHSRYSFHPQKGLVLTESTTTEKYFLPSPSKPDIHNVSKLVRIRAEIKKY
jgi:hypothetical protein